MMSKRYEAAIPEDASPVERWWYIIRFKTMDELPLETALSFPVPIIKDQTILLSAYYYIVKAKGSPQDARAGAPIARLIGSFPRSRLLFFAKREISDIFPGVKTEDDMGPLLKEFCGPDELVDRTRKLFRLYDPILEGYLAGSKATAQREDFFASYIGLTPPGLFEHNISLNPHFFHWLEA